MEATSTGVPSSVLLTSGRTLVVVVASDVNDAANLRLFAAGEVSAVSAGRCTNRCASVAAILAGDAGPLAAMVFVDF